MEKYDCELEEKCEGILQIHPEKALESFVTSSNQHLANEDAIDLLKKMLVYDHAERITPLEGLKHPYFDPINNPKK